MTDFTTIPITASGSTTARTMPDRLEEISNVKNFGAKGDGVTDDWAAIMAALNWTTNSNRGVIYFPPGNYVVSQPIDFMNAVGSPKGNVIFRGELGASTVTGNFSDYVFRRATTDTAGDSGVHAVENLSVINSHATGGGIRMGFCVGAAVRNCTVTANLGINTASDDTVAGVSSQEVAIENCILSPGANTSGSIGLMLLADGPVLNCIVTGFDKGAILWGQAGAQAVLGCRFELCGIGIQPGVKPTGASDANGSWRVAGCYFKNCGTGLLGGGGSLTFSGNIIDASEGTIAGDPQYGIHNVGGQCLYAGVLVTGQYAQSAISIQGGDNPAAYNKFIGVRAFNTSSLVRPAWSLPTTAGTAQFINCNIAPVFTTANLPAFIVGINTLSWSAGTTTANLFFNISNFTGSPLMITVEGATPSGYNGTFTATGVSGNNVTYSQTNPGSPTGSGGSAVINYQNNALEGNYYNVSDSDVSTWGGNPVGGGSTHAKVRWNGSNWTVIGK